MIAKLIAHAPTREAAAAKLAQACREVEVWPVKTNAAFLARCLAEPDFVAGRVDTGFIGARQEALAGGQDAPEPALAVVAGATLARLSRPAGVILWSGHRIGRARRGRLISTSSGVFA